MSGTKEVVKAAVETPVQAAPEGELTDADLQNVAIFTAQAAEPPMGLLEETASPL